MIFGPCSGTEKRSVHIFNTEGKMYYPITVVSVGNGDPELLNRKSFLSIKEADMVVLHSDRNPFSNWLRSQKIPYSSMDHFLDHHFLE